MDWASYKRLCDRPDIWSRWMLIQTRELLDAPLAALLDAATSRESVAKPDDHTGGAHTDMFVLRLSRASRRAVLQAVQAACESGRTTSATGARGLGGFVAAWREYADWEDDKNIMGDL